MRGVQGYVERGNADRKKAKRPEIARISGRFLMKCIGAVTLEDLHRFFRLRLNDSAPTKFAHKGKRSYPVDSEALPLTKRQT